MFRECRQQPRLPAARRRFACETQCWLRTNFSVAWVSTIYSGCVMAPACARPWMPVPGTRLSPIGACRGLADRKLLSCSVLRLDVPFIIVSAAIGEESAVAAMRAGANDYVMKDNLARLVPALLRELREADLRRERRQAQEALRVSEARYRRLAESGIIGIAVADVHGSAHEANQAYFSMMGCSRRRLGCRRNRLGRTDPGRVAGADRQAIQELQSTRSAVPWEKEVVRKDGSRVAILIGAAMLDDRNCIAFAADVTERKLAQQGWQNGPG